MRRWMFSVFAGAALALFVVASAAQATPLGGASKGIGVADPSGLELIHHKPGNKMKHRHPGRHYGWERGKHKGWYKHRRHRH
jgi:hypothetical protein